MQYLLFLFFDSQNVPKFCSSKLPVFVLGFLPLFLFPVYTNYMAAFSWNHGHVWCRILKQIKNDLSGCGNYPTMGTTRNYEKTCTKGYLQFTVQCILLYHTRINTSEIPSELSCKNFISSHVKRSQLLWLHKKSCLFNWCLYNKNMPACGYELSSHVQLEISLVSWTLKDKIPIHMLACNILSLLMVPSLQKWI